MVDSVFSMPKTLGSILNTKNFKRGGSGGKRGEEKRATLNTCLAIGLPEQAAVCS